MKATLLSALAVLAGTGLLFVPALQAQSIGLGVAVSAAPAQYPGTYTGQYPGTSPRQYPSGPYGRGRGYSGVDDYARSNGFRDGYDKGFEDARDRDRFDPRRHRWYRNGDRGYDRSYRMSRRQYEDLYRQGFLTGYQAGYRDGQRGYYGPGYGTPYPPYTSRPPRRGPTWGGWMYFRF